MENNDKDNIVKKIILEANKLAGEEFLADVAVTSLSGGQSRALMIADVAFLSSSPIVLIDEIENGFHYEALETLWKAVIEIAKEHKVQIFATTHSWENINIFTMAC